MVQAVPDLVNHLLLPLILYSFSLDLSFIRLIRFFSAFTFMSLKFPEFLVSSQF